MSSLSFGGYNNNLLNIQPFPSSGSATALVQVMWIMFFEILVFILCYC